MSMQYYSGRCSCCGAAWDVAPTDAPMAFEQAIQQMESAFCPRCGNDGSRAPVNWRFTFDYTDTRA